MIKHILVPTDGSKLSSKALSAAVDIAKLARARLSVLHIVARLDPALYAADYVLDPAVLEDSAKKARQEGRKYLQKAQETARRAGVRCAVQLVKSEQVYKGIIAAARQRDCDPIVMASHGRRGISALVLGSETTKVLTHCRRPVLVVR